MSVVTMTSLGRTSVMSFRARRGLIGSPRRDESSSSSAAQAAFSVAISAMRASSRGRPPPLPRSASRSASVNARASPMIPVLTFLVRPSTRWSTSTWTTRASFGQ